MIPACVISSTSYASLRIRWSRYCSEATAAVNGATNAFETTAPSAWPRPARAGSAGVGQASTHDLADDRERDAQDLAGDPGDDDGEQTDPERAPELPAGQPLAAADRREDADPLEHQGGHRQVGRP